MDRGPKEELDVTDDEMQLIREMEEEERRVRQQQDGAAQEYQQRQDSQYMAEVAHHQVLQEASAYRQWESWAMWSEMEKGSTRTTRNAAVVTVQGMVEGRGMQSLQWRLQPQEALCN